MKKYCKICSSPYTTDTGRRCTLCVKRSRHAYYLKNKKYICQKAKVSYFSKREEKLKNAKKWAKNNPEKRKVILNRYNKKYKKHVKARQLLNNNLRYNPIKKKCFICKKKAEAHHCDYNKPLEVIWLCKKHHMAWHRIFLAEQIK